MIFGTPKHLKFCETYFVPCCFIIKVKKLNFVNLINILLQAILMKAINYFASAMTMIMNKLSKNSKN
ncbi:hypothetical protein BpHYR1_037095 [Brachionus plicatilis]|uniref:Uncharacterized protein n=1 Tax=Brachionus plicatilis TaxID=10195 RepID=A0A3M7SBX4_BRAPC|nr:hypothetical protein BpHYR1_037095 [Brachionus plicatilis]